MKTRLARLLRRRDPCAGHPRNAAGRCAVCLLFGLAVNGPPVLPPRPVPTPPGEVSEARSRLLVPHPRHNVVIEQVDERWWSRKPPPADPMFRSTVRK